MKRFLKFSTCMVCLFLMVSCGIDSKNIIRMQALEEGVDRPTTIEELTSAIKKYQNRVEDIINAEARVGIWYKILASRYLDNQMYAKALENYRLAVEYYPTNHNLYFYIGVCAGYMAKASLDYEATGSTLDRDRYYALSESAYLRAIELHPSYARAMYAVSVLYVFELNAPQKAIPYLKSLIEIEKQNIDAMFVLARAYYATGASEESISMYNQIITITKDEKQKTDAEANKAQVLEESYGKN